MEIHSQKIISKLMKTKVISEAKSIGCYYSIGSEVQTVELITHLLEEKKIVSLPRISNGMMSFRKMGSVCQGHVDMKWTDGVDFSAGSLGMGLSFGLGCALAARMDSSDRDVWVMVGDGETQEGQFWEAAMAADFHSVGRLNLIVDRNRIQNDDFVEVQMEVGDVAKKLSSFGWDVKEIDGHSMEEVVSAIEWSSNNIGSPTAIIAHTTKGKGVSFMENNPSFHGKAPTDEELRMSLEELS